MNNFVFIVALLGVSLSSCSITKNLPGDEELLNKTVINIDNEEIDKRDLIRYQRQLPNKRILGVKFHLWLYSLSNPEKEKFPHGWLRNIGEAPVLYDNSLNEKSKEQFAVYLKNKGYHFASISDTSFTKKKLKKTVVYEIETGEPYVISKIRYNIVDKSILDVYDEALGNTLIKEGGVLDIDLLQAERNRVETFMKNKGYYKFTKDYISSEVTSSADEWGVELTTIVNESTDGKVDPITKKRKHSLYKLNNVFINSNYPVFSDSIASNDTLWNAQVGILYRNKHKVKPSILTAKNLLLPGTVYNNNDVVRTRSNYLELGMYKIANVSFEELPRNYYDTAGYRYLNGKIDLSPRKQHRTQFEIVGTNSSGDAGIRGNIAYFNHNLFRGAESFNLVFTGAIESVSNRHKLNTPMRELGVESEIVLPKFLLPFRTPNFTRKFNPNSTIRLSYNYQDRPDYIRTIVNGAFGYQWRGNIYNKHSVFPINFDYIKLPEGIKDEDFEEQIKNTPLENSYTNHAILGLRYVFEFSNQKHSDKRSFHYLRMLAESAGLATSAIKRSFNGFGTDSTILGVPFFQYVKADFDYRQYFRLLQKDILMYRVFLGAGYSYGVSQTLPFERMYFAGGPYGIRAWSTRTLGPGSYSDTTSVYFNNLGDIKLEANLEYRFKLFWKLEGAMFFDAGNIWLFRDFGTRPGGVFRWGSFVDDIAVGTGVGARFDFSFLLLRLDLGYKLRDPSIKEGTKWNIVQNKKVRDPWVWQFGISYPF